MSIKSKTTEMTTPAEETAPAPAVPVGKAAETTATAAAARFAETSAPAANEGIDATVSTMKENAARAAASLNETQAKMKDGMDKAMKTAEEMVAFSQGNLEAVMKSGQIWTAGMQDLSRQMAASAQSSLEETMSTFKALSGVKSLKDAMDLQANLARSAMEKSFAESGRLSDASFKLAEQALAPITTRMTMAVEKFAKPV